MGVNPMLLLSFRRQKRSSRPCGALRLPQRPHAAGLHSQSLAGLLCSESCGFQRKLQKASSTSCPERIRRNIASG